MLYFISCFFNISQYNMDFVNDNRFALLLHHYIPQINPFNVSHVNLLIYSSTLLANVLVVDFYNYLYRAALQLYFLCFVEF